MGVERSASGRNGGYVVFPIWDAIGYACYSIWGFTLYFGNLSAMLGGGAFGDGEVRLVRLMLIVGTIVSAVVHYGLRNKMDEAGVPFAYTLLFVGMAATPLATLVPGLSVSYLCVVFFLAGALQTLAFMFWRMRFAFFRRDQMTMIVVASTVLAATFVPLLNYTDPVVFFSLLAIVSLVSNCCHVVAQRSDPAGFVSESRERRNEKVDKSRRSKMVKKNIFTGLYQIIFGFTMLLLTATELFPINLFVWAAGQMLSIVVFCIYRYALKRDMSRMLTAFLLPVLAVCLIFVAFLQGSMLQLVPLGVIGFVMNLYFFHGEESNNEESLSSTRLEFLESSTTERMSFMVGFGGGWLLGCLALMVPVASAWAPLLVVAYGLVALCATVEKFLFRTSAIEQDMDFFNPIKIVSADSSDDEDLWTQKRALLADEYGLTPRQKEIFIMLCRGRNAEYIQEQFTLSKYTVKSHMYTIYGKLGVHSQQELISLAESYEVEIVGRG